MSSLRLWARPLRQMQSVMPCRGTKNEIAATGSSKEEKSTLSGLPVERLNRDVTISYVGRPPNQNTYENVEFWRLSYNTTDRYDTELTHSPTLPY